MKKLVFNPYLPSWEYIPDAEPRVFGNRVYIYGSHDRFNGKIFCLNDYVCWSAPVDDLSDWRYEGVIYRKKQDPANRLGLRLLFAPDVVRGPDGRYYLYYCFDFKGEMGVAVSEKPEGPFGFYGKVHFKDGHIWGRQSGEPFPFDPGALVDGEQVWLYSGFATKVPPIASGFYNLDNQGGVVLELEKDMLTIKQGPKLLFPRKGLPGAFEGHAFFEASSIRKIADKYYFVYSSEHNHDLCYAVSNQPDGPFEFKGVLVDIGDVFLNGRNDEKDAVNYLGNTHGGLLNIGDQWYIFYHRQTNRHSYSRQACAEKLNRAADGAFLQAEITSCGLNDGPLPGTGRYDAYIACNLMGKEGTLRVDIPGAGKKLANHPYFTQKGKDCEYGEKQYIANMQDGSVAGFKYFLFSGEEKRISVKGNGEGCFLVTDGEKEAAIVKMNQTADFRIEKGIKALFFRYMGKDAADFEEFTIE